MDTINKIDTSVTTNSFIIFEDKVPNGIPSIFKSNFNVFINDNAIATNKNNFYLYKLNRIYFSSSYKHFLKKMDGSALSEYNSKSNFYFYTPVEDDLTVKQKTIQVIKSPNSLYLNAKIDELNLSNGLYSIVITDKKDVVQHVYLFNFTND